jgi:hypothetical protein
MTDLPLLPAPRELRRGRGTHQVGRGWEVAGGGRAAARARTLPSADLRGVADRPSRLALHHDATLPAEGFTLTIEPDGLRIAAADERGALWAVETIRQLVAGCGAELPCLELRDWPDLPERGYLLDVSRDRVPTMESLRALVDRLALLRVTQLQLYTEHTFAFRGHDTVWQHASPFTPDELRSLDGWCDERGIELVPNLACFGHMERWLAHPAYRHLAELPDGRMDGRPSSCLTPGPEALAFVQRRWEEFLACFRSRRVNINCDETVELGQGRSRSACERDGAGKVWARFVGAIVEDLQRRSGGYAVQLWADMIAHYPAILDDLPRDGVTALVWTYERPRPPESVPAAVHPYTAGFGPPVEHLAGRGVAVMTCPGTSTWNALVGRWRNARENVLDAVRTARAAGSRGVLLTDWGDNGHLNPPAASIAPLAFGAAAAWSLAALERTALPTVLDALFFGGAGTAARALRAGDAAERLGLTALNGTPFAYHLLRAGDDLVPAWGETTPEELEAALADLDAAATLDGDSPLTGELSQAARLARLGARRLGRERLGHGPTDAALCAELDALRERQQAVWLQASRPGGLADSLARLDRVRRALAGSAP